MECFQKGQEELYIYMDLRRQAANDRMTSLTHSWWNARWPGAKTHAVITRARQAKGQRLRVSNGAMHYGYVSNAEMTLATPSCSFASGQEVCSFVYNF